jgi:two-component system cell cycle sensor histidine kinase PleC
MSNGVSTSTDKNIVDKSRSHRNKPVAKAVRVTRERLQSSHAPSGAFDRDVLNLYINAVLQGASIIPLFVIIIAILGIYFTGDTQIVLWAILTLTAHAVNVFLARRARKREMTAIRTRKWRRLLLLGQFLIGCCWAYFAIQDCAACEPANLVLYKGATLLIALSLTAMWNYMLTLCVLVTF